jgi:hypothetical protein
VPLARSPTTYRGATAEQQIEAPAMRGEEFIPASGGPIGHGPVSVGEIVFAGGLDHAVQRVCSMILSFLI